MALRRILYKGDPALRKKSREITEFGPRLHELLDDMKETMRSVNGVGLAAPQVGVLRRAVIVADTTDSEAEDPVIIEFINPEIVKSEGEQEGYEGCLSIPGQYGFVKRPMCVKVRAFDRHGKRFEISREEFLARALCHEVDHLNGRLYIDLTDQVMSIEEFEAMQEKDEESK